MNVSVIERLTEELVSLIGYGARPHHVLVRPTLVTLARARHGELEPKVLAQIILRELREAALDLPVKESEAVQHLLALDRRHGLEGRVPAPERRWQAIMALGGGWSVGTFRRHNADSPETELMREFAGVIFRRLAGPEALAG